jgi:hypothetical protein
MKRVYHILLASLIVASAVAQPKFSQPHGLYDVNSLTVTITGNDADAVIRYTTDGSEPTRKSTKYTAPLTIKKTTLLRAVEVKGDSISSVATASYIFVNSVLNQPNNPTGYPDTWGQYTQISGTAKADYEMDPEMTGDSNLRPKIIEGLKQLPILSIVSDKDNFFSHENDSVKGGIYIFTGPPVGDATGHGWTRQASVELIGGPQGHDYTGDCGIRLHGGHGRLAEKNPKHSFRLVFKKEYGKKTMKYPIYGEDEPSQFNQLVLRCHFGNAWQHWSEDNRQKAQYTRDVWARRMQRKMGHTSVNALYVHLFLNGMYWGLYNIAERVDDQFGKDHLGGKKSDIDVIKIEEDGGNHIEASEGDLTAWELMTSTASKASDDKYYEKLDTLLDINSFIDYMLINQYAGNTDWDHHNWYAVRRHNNDSTVSEGFRFLCWDSELILGSQWENVLGKNNGTQFPTGIFQNLLRNDKFARRYVKRAKEVFADDGLLGEESVVQVWDSLYHTIDKALYDEAARWGDYRRDVHRWQSGGQLYTVDDFYLPERNRLLSEYFPSRSAKVLNDILNYVNVDDFEAPEEWEPLTPNMFYVWDGTGADAKPTNEWNVDWNLNQALSGGNVVVGSNSVTYNQFADLSQYDRLIVRGSGSGFRMIVNRLVDHGPYIQLVTDINEQSPYWDAEYGVLSIPLDDVCGMADSQGKQRVDNFVHLNTIKVNSGGQLTVKGIYLLPKKDVTTIEMTKTDSRHDNRLYNLSGQEITHPMKGLYIRNGRKVIVR